MCFYLVKLTVGESKHLKYLYGAQPAARLPGPPVLLLLAALVVLSVMRVLAKQHKQTNMNLHM